MSIGQRIKNERIRLHLSQEDVAKAISTTKQAIYKYENEIVTNIPMDKVEKMAKLFNVTAAYLMGWEESSTPRFNKKNEEKKRLPDEREQAVTYFEKIYIELWNMPRDALLKIRYSLSKGKWPDILPGKPYKWEEKETHEKNLWSVPICKEIEEIVGVKGCTRYDSKIDGRETGQAYDDLWDSGFWEKVDDLYSETCKQGQMLFEIREKLASICSLIKTVLICWGVLVVGISLATLILVLIG